MNRDLDSLVRGPLAILGALVVALVVLGTLVAQGVTTFIVPPPEEVGQLFFTSLKAHNFEAAHNALSEPLRQTVTPADLRALERRLEETTQGIDQATGESATTQGDTATAEVKVTLENRRAPIVTVPMTLENGLWHIASLAPLEALIASP
jgi:hypothetical protein